MKPTRLKQPTRTTEATREVTPGAVRRNDAGASARTAGLALPADNFATPPVRDRVADAIKAPQRFSARSSSRPGAATRQATLQGKDVERTSAPLATTKRTIDLPDAWLRAATESMHAMPPLESTYDLRVALHGAPARALIKAAGFAGGFDSARELVLMNFTDAWDLQANIFAFDVERNTLRALGTTESGELDAVLGWDGTNTPKRFANAALLPVGPDAWDSGKRLAGFDDIAEYMPKEPIDFAAIDAKPLGPDRRPAMRELAPVLAAVPASLDFYRVGGNAGGSSVSIASATVTHTIEASPGTSFVSAGWSTDASIDAAILGLVNPRGAGEAWTEANDAIADSRFGASNPRPLLWLAQSDGAVRFVAFSAQPTTPAVLEVGTNPLAVRLHGAG